MIDLITRVKACDKTSPDWFGRPFILGQFDCAHLGAAFVKAMGLPDPLDGLAAYETEQQAAKIMKAAFGTVKLEKALDGLYKRLDGPLFCLPGDILAMQSGEAKWPALGVYLAPNAVLAFVAGTCQRIDMQYAMGAAWRVE